MTPMRNQCSRTRDEEVIVYLVFSPESGPAHRIYTEEDIQIYGGIHGIERLLETESYWFVQLGQVCGVWTRNGLTMSSLDIAQLSTPASTEWRLGRCNPAFRSSELEQYTFHAAFKCVERMLEGWKQERDGWVEAYALKALKINSKRLESLTRALQTVKTVYEMAEITVIKYSYDPSWPKPHLPGDLVDGEFSLRIPLQFARSSGQKLISVEVMSLALC